MAIELPQSSLDIPHDAVGFFNQFNGERQIIFLTQLQINGKGSRSEEYVHHDE